MGLFLLPQMAQMDTDSYSLNTNTCIIRGIRVEINNPQNSDGIQTEGNPLYPCCLWDTFSVAKIHILKK